MQLLLNDNADLSAKITGFNVIGFSEGSLIVYWNLIVIASENETMVNISKSINQAINETLTHTDFLMKSPLKTENVRILSISLAINPCQNSDLNYCSRHADCIRNNYRAGGFLCQCKTGTIDLSETPHFHPGEVCKVICSSNYCGSHGDCKVTRDGEMECLCRGWYLGSKCQISGVGLLSAITSAQMLFIFVACVCYARRKRRRHLEYERHQRNYSRTHDYGFEGYNSQVDDVVALDERLVDNCSRFQKLSLTPALPQQPIKGLPRITVIPPSISNMSYSVDSSFDTPSDVSSTSVRSMTP